MTIEQRLAEIIRAFCLDVLSSAVDLDVVLCVLAQALLAAFRARLGGPYHSATPVCCNAASSTPSEQSPTTARSSPSASTGAYSPVLRQADIPVETAVPWWGGRRLRFEIA
jgi:hypothetical protein